MIIIMILILPILEFLIGHSKYSAFQIFIQYIWDKFNIIDIFQYNNMLSKV